MKIKMALIPNVYAVKAQELSITLQNAIEWGNMHTVDQISKELLLLAVKDHSLNMSEESWHNLIKAIRDTNDDYKSECLMTPQQLKPFNEICVKDLFHDVSVIIDQALRTDCCVLQLPFVDGGEHV